MGTTLDKLNKLASTKDAIKAAIIGKGQSVEDSDTFASYADKISALSDVKTGTATAAYSQTFSIPAIAGAKNVALTLYNASATVTSWKAVVVEKFEDGTSRVVCSDGTGNIYIRGASEETVTVGADGTIKLGSMYFAAATYFYVAW